jgi:hypothetical protein
MKNIYDILRAKEAQLNQLQREIEALQLAASLLAEESDTPGPRAAITKKPIGEIPAGSVITQPLMVRSVLLDSGESLHVDKIADAIAKKFSVRMKPAYLTSIIYRSVKKGKLFRKDGANTFGLLEWPSGHQQGAIGESVRVQ